MKTKKQIEKEEEEKEERTWNFNEGRLSCDRKWIDEINDRIKELEKLVGIPELRRLIKESKYKWKNDEKEQKEQEK